MSKMTAAQFKKAHAKNSDKSLPDLQSLSVSDPLKQKIATKGIKRKSKTSNSNPQERKEGAPKTKPTLVPSAASGGVPSATNRYLTQVARPPSQINQPRRILIIMDLNGTLLYRPTKRKPFHFVERPHAQQFLHYCINNFAVAIWSSARPQNVGKMVDRLLTPDLRSKCVVIWGRDKLGLSKDDYDAKVQVYKRLTAIWADPQVKASHPEAETGGCWDQTNTVLIDDSEEKGRSEPYNMLQIPEFAGIETELPNVLPQVHDYINTLCGQSDISSYIRRSPFVLDSGYCLQ
ncbi:hypothetical protein Golomagni_07858 [Golovinomyces magnicellulatus]|nr:hypothetical protein Golomagni_07858 [Golovinomyces magnicellulatus]